MSSLLDPSLLKGLSKEQREEALAAAAAAKRAEERAEQRALERAMQRKEEERRQMEQQQSKAYPNFVANANSQHSNGQQRVFFVPKRKRGSATNQDAKDAPSDRKSQASVSHNQTKASGSQEVVQNHRPRSDPRSVTAEPTRYRDRNGGGGLSEKELSSVKEAYLGKSAAEKEEDAVAKRKKQKTTKKITFKFRWEDEEDTFDEDDPLYSHMPASHSSLGGRQDRNVAGRGRSRIADSLMGSGSSIYRSVQNKPLAQMTARDWKIFRENMEIKVKGGRAPPPMRSFRESPSPDVVPNLHPALLDAIENVLRFKDPSPIQRQAIPIGLQRRDLIGIAETGSGKTVAFGVPLCHYLLNLPQRVLSSVAADGPLALIMAPTRELALQIDGELQKLLSRQRTVLTGAVIGGQSIQHQAQMIRNGVHIVVGTPGRLNDCIEMAYLVLNQCSYLVLDEADRMIEMGFREAIASILDSMGGSLKSEREDEAYEQERADLNTSEIARHRVTAMFSATMPMEVERLAKQYLRHPAVVSIGDEDSGKNARITQRVIFVASTSHKEKALRDQLNDHRFLREKVLVFVNEKKHADHVGRMVERSGRSCVVMHGGKSQEQREDSLEKFRLGGIVMVATDVAGRGLDIPDVAHVINFDLPTRSIENYTHRIGRTGRAGKRGLATSFITDDDEGIMAPLKAYLESTGNSVPDRLARHPAASAGSTGNLIY
mmetsp:Transcript_7808/g.21768  ORF Transcript_7808/g.21768 Transcript_7808/m.21768 type:complete len:715 (+) Transcript_7808:72-2216(+)